MAKRPKLHTRNLPPAFWGSEGGGEHNREPTSMKCIWRLWKGENVKKFIQSVFVFLCMREREREREVVRQHKRYSYRSWEQKHTHQRACWGADSLCQSSMAWWHKYQWLDLHHQQHSTCTPSTVGMVPASSFHQDDWCDCPQVLLQPPGIGLIQLASSQAHGIFLHVGVHTLRVSVKEMWGLGSEIGLPGEIVKWAIKRSSINCVPAVGFIAKLFMAVDNRLTVWERKRGRERERERVCGLCCGKLWRKRFIWERLREAAKRGP